MLTSSEVFELKHITYRIDQGEDNDNDLTFGFQILSMDERFPRDNEIHYYYFSMGEQDRRTAYVDKVHASLQDWDENWEGWAVEEKKPILSIASLGAYGECVTSPEEVSLAKEEVAYVNQFDRNGISPKWEKVTYASHTKKPTLFDGTVVFEYAFAASIVWGSLTEGTLCSHNSGMSDNEAEKGGWDNHEHWLSSCDYSNGGYPIEEFYAKYPALLGTDVFYGLKEGGWEVADIQVYRRIKQPPEEYTNCFPILHKYLW